ncbi:esterase/lipase family protein [Novosphingobium tardum]|uniref:Esterase/lipase family protein n=1 Tax=Novosphingobium tardum TaxID=1538021 RepID=A0ABV8RM10_9SPHN
MMWQPQTFALKARRLPGFDNAARRMREMRTEMGRRTTLARQPQPEGVTAPRIGLLLGELTTAADIWRARRDAEPPARGEAARTVMLLPGFGTHPFRMRALRHGLTAAGHEVIDWGEGFNLGASAELFDRVCGRVERAAQAAGAPIALVGWSLGGLFAREAAKRRPDAVDLVVTMGTPFSGDLHANNAWRAYHWIAGHDVTEPPIGGDFSAKPPARTVAMWSPRDGIVAPRSAAGRPGERDAAIALRCTHLGFASHPAVLSRLVAELDGSAL